MHPGAAPPLERHRIFHSRKVEETHAFLHSKNFHLDTSPRRAGALDARLNGVYMPGAWLGYIQYGAEVAIRAVGRDDYWVQMPVRGQIEVVDSSHRVVCDTRCAAIASHACNDFYLVRTSEGCGGIRLSLTRAALIGQLTALLGAPPSQALAFSPVMDVTSGHGRTLARCVLMATADLENAGSMLGSATVVTAFEQFVMTGLLQSQPHNYTEALRRLERSIAPRDVRRAIDYIEAHLDTSLTVADLVAATGVAGRTLFKHFKDFKGVSPMRYARDARFREVRRGLLQAAPEESVTGIAMRWGFAHMGRFSVEYRQRFGEKPSETLTCRKGVRPPSTTVEDQPKRWRKGV